MGVGSQHHAPGRFNPRNDLVPIVLCIYEFVLISDIRYYCKFEQSAFDGMFSHIFVCLLVHVCVKNVIMLIN
jgi:hypothetical protein